MNAENKIKLAAAGLFLVLILTTKKAVKKMLNDQTKKDFLNKIIPHAKAAGAKIGVPWQFIVAQVALETRYGLSTLFSKYNNVGGVKAVGTQKYVVLPTKEDLNPGINDGKTKTVYQKFAVYPSLAAGLEAHTKVLTNRYFKQYQNKTSDPVQYARLLQSKAPKYATDDRYVNKIDTTLKDINRVLLI